MVIKPTFNEAEEFSEDVGLVRGPGGFFYINKAGEQLFGRTFRAATPFVLGLAHVAFDDGRERRWGYIDHQGTMVYSYPPPW